MKIEIDDSDHNQSKEIIRLIENRNGSTRMIGFQTEKGLYEASIKLCHVEYCHISLDQSSKLWHWSLGHANKKVWILYNVIPKNGTRQGVRSCDEF